LQQHEFIRRKNTKIFFEFAVSRRFKTRIRDPIGYQKTDKTAYRGEVYHLSASKNAFELVRMKKITAVVHATAICLLPIMSSGDLWIICQNLSVLKYQAAARFGRQFNCTGYFSKHYKSTCKN
jgi:hypothetical protein